MCGHGMWHAARMLPRVAGPCHHHAVWRTAGIHSDTQLLWGRNTPPLCTIPTSMHGDCAGHPHMPVARNLPLLASAPPSTAVSPHHPPGLPIWWSGEFTAIPACVGRPLKCRMRGRTHVCLHATHSHHGRGVAQHRHPCRSPGGPGGPCRGPAEHRRGPGVAGIAVVVVFGA